jgi:hypothetical protein
MRVQHSHAAHLVFELMHGTYEPLLTARVVDMSRHVIDPARTGRHCLAVLDHGRFDGVRRALFGTDLNGELCTRTHQRVVTVQTCG